LGSRAHIEAGYQFSVICESSSSSSFVLRPPPFLRFQIKANLSAIAFSIRSFSYWPSIENENDDEADWEGRVRRDGQK
jgi:hypothetical protein